MKDMSPPLKELLTEGLNAKRRGDHRNAREKFQAALVEAQRMKDDQGEANALLELSAIAIQVDSDRITARRLLEKCLEIYTRTQFDLGRAYAMSNLGSLALDEGKYDNALQWLNRALVIFEREQDKYGMAMTLHQMGKVDKQRGDIVSAEKRWRQSLLIFEGLGDKFAMGQVLLSLAGVSFAHHKDLRQAKLLLNRALALFEELGLPHEAAKVRHNLAIIERREK